MANELIQALTLTTLAMTLALLLVLTIRTPLRRLFGAQVAYLAWWLVPLAMLAVLLPAPVREAATLARGALVALDMAPMQAVAADSTAIVLPDYRIWLPLLWFCGVVFAALFFHRMQRRYLRALGVISPVGGGIFVSQAAGACPAVVGAWKPRIVLPADFEARYPSREGEMVLAHERAHLRRGDTTVNLAVVALRCAYWFNPLLHWAASRFRQDQEMACDAVVLGQFPDRRRTYAEAMLKTQLAVLGLPVGCHWQSSQSLKERILMLKQPLPGRRRLRAGILTVGIAVCLGSYAAWALQPSNLVKAPVMVGSVIEEAVAVANVVVVGDSKQVEMSSGAMTEGPNGSTDIFLVPRFPFKASVGQGGERWALETSVTKGQSPVVSWTLSHAGRVVQQSQTALQDGRPLLLQVGKDGPGATRLLVSISTAPADKVMRMARADDPAFTEQPQLDNDGAYRYAHGDGSWGRGYAVSGEAVLLLTLDAEGMVRDVTIEQVKPAGALTLAQAQLHVKDHRYSPKVENGRAVPSRIRLPLRFGPEPPPLTGNADASIKHAPAPAYPTDPAVKGRIVTVSLVIDVAADGSVQQAKVENEGQDSPFEKAAVAAALKWKFNPAYKDGKPVETRLRVPVTFGGSATGKEGDADAKRG
jgi:bla regulator protein blaR1